VVHPEVVEVREVVVHPEVVEVREVVVHLAQAVVVV
jgi:hypothetical protein